MNAEYANDWADVDPAIVNEERPPQRNHAGMVPLPEAYYDSAYNRYWIRDHQGGWITVPETGLKRFLKADGVSAQLINGERLSAVDAAVLGDQQSQQRRLCRGVGGVPERCP